LIVRALACGPAEAWKTAGAVNRKADCCGRNFLPSSRESDLPPGLRDRLYSVWVRIETPYFPQSHGS